MINLRIMNKKSQKYIYIIKGTFSEIRDYVKMNPDGPDPFAEKGPGVDVRGEENILLELRRGKKASEYVLRNYETDESLEGQYGDIMYAAVKSGWLKKSSMLEWTFKSDEYWDIQSRDHSPSEHKLCELVDVLEALPGGSNFLGELKWRPDTFKKH